MKIVNMPEEKRDLEKKFSKKTGKDLEHAQNTKSNFNSIDRARLTRLTIKLSRGLNSTMRNPIRFDFSPTKVYTCIIIIQS